MSRFFISPEQFDRPEPVISGPDVRHITKVLRLGPGDAVELLDGGFDLVAFDAAVHEVYDDLLRSSVHPLW